MAGEYDTTWRPWPVWSAVWVGALAAIAVGLLIGLIGFAVGAHQLASPRSMSFKNIKLLTVAFDIAGAFFAFVVGGWVAARIAGLRRAEPAMLHGAVVWALAIPMLLLFGALGATANFGGWYTGLAGTPVWANVAVPPVNPETAAALRNAASAAVIALLLGLAGSVLGGWMASGEPMSLTYYRRRTLEPERPRRVA
jgi:hypothetical protein